MFTGLLKEIWLLLTEMAPYIFFGLFVAGILHVIFPSHKIEKYFSGNSPGAVLRASLFGIPLPLCSCGVIPVAAHLRKEGAGSGPTISFLISTPTTGVDSILATFALLGPVFAIIRPVAAFVAGCLAGLIFYFTGHEEKRPSIESREGRKSFVWHKENPVVRIKEIFHYAFVELVRDIGKWLMIGIVAGGFISYFIPQDFIQNYLGTPWLAYPLMLLIAVPLYVCATGSIPIAASLIMKGMTPGAGLIFLIAGPATNTATLSFVGGKMGKKMLTIYLVTIIVVSIIFGLALDFFYASFDLQVAYGPHVRGIFPYAFKVVCAIVLILAVLLSAFTKWMKPRAKIRSDRRACSGH